MKNSILVSLSMMLITNLMALPALGYGNFDRSFRKGLLEFGAFSKYSYSDANYTSGGSTSNLNSGYSFQTFDIDVVGRMAFEDLAIYGGTTISNAQSKDNINSRMNSSLSQGFLGLEYRMADRYLDVIAELGAVLPFDKINEAADVSVNAESVNQIRLGMTLQKQFGSSKIYGRAAYVTRETRSALVDWATGMEWGFGTWSGGAELSGITSVKDDGDKGGFREIARANFLNKVNAGSMTYYSVNPSYVDLTGILSLSFNRLNRVEFTGGGTLTGSNYASNFHVGANLVLGFDMGMKKAKAYESHMSTDEVNDNKEEVQDGVDQRLFQPTPPPPVHSKPKASTPVVTDEQIQQQLDDAEMQINLKTNKKKKK